MRVYQLDINQKEHKQLLALVKAFHSGTNDYANQLMQDINDGGPIIFPPSNVCIIRSCRGNIRVTDRYIKLPGMKSINTNGEHAPVSTVALIKLELYDTSATMIAYTVGELQLAYGSLINWQTTVFDI